MRLVSIEFENFRCFRSEKISFNNYTSLVGPNNCGKSTALRALTIFFNGGPKTNLIENSDFYVGADTDARLTLKFEFDGVTGEAETQLSHYVRNGRVKFELIAERDENGQVSTVCRGIRFGMETVAPFFAASKATERRPIYEELRAQFPSELPSWQNMDQAEAAVRALEAARADQHVEIPSAENAYGATGPIPSLRKFIDWIYVPAVKEAASEASELRESAFSKLIFFAVRNRCNFADRLVKIRSAASDELKKVLDETTDVLNEVGGEIDKEFKKLTSTPIDVAIEWGAIEGVSVREPAINSLFKDGRVRGAPHEFGHGLQRTYLMALLALASRVQREDDSFHLLLGVEEPELYQHPPQARFLANALADLAEGNCQVIVTTHSPHFIYGRTFEGIRTLRKRDNVTKVHSWSIDEQRSYCAIRKGGAPIGATAALSGMDRSLQTSISEIFFAGKVVLVEGPEDIAIVESYLKKKGKLSDFLRAGGHFVAVGGKTKMHNIIALARGFAIDVYCIFDLDLNLGEHNQKNEDIIRYAADVGDVLPQQLTDEFAGERFFGWKFNIQESLKAEVPSWSETTSQIATEWGWTLDRMNKDPMLLAEAVSRIVDCGGDIPPLQRVCGKLEQFWRS